MPVSSKTVQLFILGAALALFLAACASDMERSGVSNRPQNAPADWESQKTTINSD